MRSKVVPFMVWQVERTESDHQLLETFKTLFLGLMEVSQEKEEQAHRQASVRMGQRAGSQDPSRLDPMAQLRRRERKGQIMDLIPVTRKKKLETFKQMYILDIRDLEALVKRKRRDHDRWLMEMDWQEMGKDARIPVAEEGEEMMTEEDQLRTERGTERAQTKRESEKRMERAQRDSVIERWLEGVEREGSTGREGGGRGQDKRTKKQKEKKREWKE